MARLNVNPTRMELTRLKSRLVVARRGHKLLKDKRDELMRRFMLLVRENRALRKEVENGVANANSHMALARSVMSDAAINTALLMPSQKMNLALSTKDVMSIKLPKISAEFKKSDENEMYSYGFAFTSSELDDAVLSLSELLPKMIKLAEIEKSCQLMAVEIERTRRRVNALEYVMIPQYEETIKYIQMRLDENERSSTTRLMKVKAQMAEEERRKALSEIEKQARSFTA